VTVGRAISALAATAATLAEAAVTVAARPPLRPRFDRAVTDYVARCPVGKPERVSVKATHGDRVSVSSESRATALAEGPDGAVRPGAENVLSPASPRRRQLLTAGARGTGHGGG
jgi:hypothetical protein